MRIPKKSGRKLRSPKKEPSESKFHRFCDIFEVAGGPEIRQESKKTGTEIHEFFDMRKKYKKKSRENFIAGSASCAGPAGGFRGLQYSVKVCKNLEIMQGISSRSLCRVYYYI